LIHFSEAFFIFSEIEFEHLSADDD